MAKPRLYIAAAELPLFAAEAACVAPAAVAILDPGHHGPLIPAAVILALGLAAGYVVMLAWLRRVWEGWDEATPAAVHAACRLSVWATPLRIAAYGAAAATAAGGAALGGEPPVLVLGLASLAVNGAFPAVLRSVLYDRVLTVPLQDRAEPDPLRRFATRYHARLAGAALASGGLGIAGATAFLFLFLPAITLEQYRALQGPFAFSAAALTLAFLPLPRRLSRPIDAYLSEPSEARAHAALRCGTLLPYHLAAVKIVSWLLGAIVLGVQALLLARMSAELSVLCTVAAFLMAVGAAIYETTWHRATLRPLLAEIARKHPLLLRRIRTRVTLRTKILASFGTLAFFVCSFSLFWSFVQYRYLAMSFIQRHAMDTARLLTTDLREQDLTADPVRLVSRAAALAPRGDAVVHFVPASGPSTAIAGKGETPSLSAEMVRTIRRRGQGWLDASTMGMQGAFDLLDPDRPELGSLLVLHPGYQVRGTPLESHVQFLVLFFVVLFATATGIVTLVARDLAQPVKLLERRAEGMGRGDLRSAVPIGPEPDELGRLAVAFEETRRALDDKIAALEELHASLEQKVIDRTADLERSNLELRQTLEALRVAQAKLIASEKMAVVGQITAGVAHEINNPVNAVVNTVEPLENLVWSLTRAGDATSGPNREARAELGEMLRVIKSGAERTKLIVQALRNYARGGRDEAVDYEIHRGLDEALELLRHELRGSIEVDRQYGAAGSLKCRAGQLNQVFVNLITNAAQALHGRNDGRIVVRTRDRNGEVEIQVADNGPGIPPAMLPRIFDPFFTTKPVGEGTGLGLSISQQIVERHGGSLRVESSPGQGATFTVVLPRA